MIEGCINPTKRKSHVMPMLVIKISNKVLQSIQLFRHNIPPWKFFLIYYSMCLTRVMLGMFCCLNMYSKNWVILNKFKADSLWCVWIKMIFILVVIKKNTHSKDNSDYYYILNFVSICCQHDLIHPSAFVRSERSLETLL